jgi:hypothetical protein
MNKIFWLFLIGLGFTGISSLAQYEGQLVEDEYGNQYKLVDPNRPGASYGNPYPMPRNFSQPNFNANAFRPQDTIAPTQRALENYAAAEERRQQQEQNYGWETVINMQAALARGASIADQQSILEARAAATEAQRLANEREKMEQRRLALQEELYLNKIDEIKNKDDGKKSDKSDSLPVFASPQTSNNYGGTHEIPESLKKYQSEISRIIAFEKKQIDIGIVREGIEFAKRYQVPEKSVAIIKNQFDREQVFGFIRNEIEKFKKTVSDY